MKTKLLLSLLIFLLFSHISVSSQIIDDNFDAETLGDLPTGWVIKFNGTGDANQKVVNTTSVSPNNSFEIEGLSGGNDANLYKTPTTLPNKVSIEAYVKAEKIMTNYTGSFGLSSLAGDIWGTSCMRVMFKDGKLVANYRNGNDYEIQEYTVNQWYHIKLEANLTDKLYQVYIDGIQVSGTYASNTITQFPMHPTSAPSVIMLATGDGSNKMWFDDVKLYETLGLLAYYPFNGNANDESGNEHHGTVYEALLTQDKDGNENSAYYFDGVNDYIDLGDWENGGAMSFTFWARWDALNHWSRIIDIGNGTRNDDVMVGTYQSSNEVAFYVNKVGSSSYILFSTPAITLNLWDFYVTTVDTNGLMKIYKNGVLLEEYTNGFTPNKLIRTEQYLGRSLYNGDEFFKGAIDELRIYNSALSESDILSLYTNNALNIEKLTETKERNFYISNNTLHFKSIQNLNDIKSIEVYNLLGQKVFETSKIEEEIKLENLRIGIYITKVNAENGYQTLKFINR